MQAMDLGMRDKVAIVTGSSRGLGLASAKALAAEGCRVSLCARTEATLHAAAREVSSVAGGDDRVLAVRADLARTEGVQTVIDRTVERFGGIDVLVNNLGLARGAGLLETSDEEWQEAFDHTLMPAVRASRLAVPHMQRRGGGAIVIVASIFAREIGGRMTYSAVKAAEIGLTKSLAQQLASIQHPRHRRLAGVDSLRGWIVVEAAAGEPGRDRRFREAGAAVRPLRPGRRDRRCRRLSRLTAGELGQRDDRGRRWLPESRLLTVRSH